MADQEAEEEVTLLATRLPAGDSASPLGALKEILKKGGLNPQEQQELHQTVVAAEMYLNDPRLPAVMVERDPQTGDLRFRLIFRRTNP